MIANLVQLAAEEEQNPLIPPGPELLVGTIAFAIVFFFFGRSSSRTSTRFWKSAARRSKAVSKRPTP